jgi:pimeloyl-ACP methyl ester carboxylesterase
MQFSRVALAMVAVAMLAGAGIARATPPTPLFVDCRGGPTTSPTVVLEAGAFGTSADWDLVLDDLAKGGRVCAYDRSGLGRSPSALTGLDVVSRARELSTLLDDLGETRPVILVGHSNGALYAEAFARLWPERVVGLVYVNGVGSDDLDDPVLLSQLAQERRLSDLAVVAGRLGLAGAVAGKLTRGEGLTGETEARKRAALTCLRCLVTARDEDRLIVPGLIAVRALPGDVRHIPTVVIVGDPHPAARLARTWRAAEIAPATHSDHGWILDAPGASHVSPLARDRGYIDAAVGWLRAPFVNGPAANAP